MPERTSEQPAGSALHLHAVEKSFVAGRRQTQALAGVDLEVGNGLVTGLIGPDGAGKTTLMRLAAGLLLPDAGQVTVLGMDTASDALTIQSSIGYMPQRFGLYEDLSVQENLDLYADLQGLPRDQRAERYGELMHMTGLGPFTTRLAGRLSGGMKQKLGLACTLVRPPRLLLLDEPTVGVDPVSRRELWSIVYRLVEQEGMSVLLSTAYLDEAERCHRVALLHEGRLLGDGPPAQFSAKMQGRTFAVDVPAAARRATQVRLSHQPKVLDAIIHQGRVRLLMHQAGQPQLAELLPEQPSATISPVAPRFEDSFIATLHHTRSDMAAGLAAAADTGAPTAEAVIRVDGLTRRFGDFYAVRDISFKVGRGEVFGLLGANGAGKSTTFRMLCGLLPPSDGHLQVAGVDLRHAPAAARARIGYMSQRFSLYANLSVRQNLAFFSNAYNLRGTQRRERMAWALEHFELEAQADAASGNLPLGYKQRLALACALMHEPEILFLDEPTSGVDPLARREFWQRINTLAGQGVTILVTTHFMEEAEYCDRLAIMAAGSILTLGTPDTIKEAVRGPEHPQPSMEDAFIHLIETQETAA